MLILLWGLVDLDSAVSILSPLVENATYYME